jgi:hypothetical protein
MDPRVTTPESGLRQQYSLSRALDAALRRAAAALEQARTQGAAKNTVDDLQRQMSTLGQLFGLVEGADVAPTAALAAAAQDAVSAVDRAVPQK